MKLKNFTKRVLKKFRRPGMRRMEKENRRLRKRLNDPAALERAKKIGLHPESFLIITLDSCRYDIFDQADIPAMKSIGDYYCANPQATFTFASHAALFVGMTPGVATSRERYKNPKVGRIFRIVNKIAGGIRSDYIQLQGRTIVDGYKNIGYRTLGTAASRWFNPKVSTGQILTSDFEEFFYTLTDVEAQVAWLLERMNKDTSRPFFTFINIMETHVPYHHQGAPWEKKNPCVLFGENNDADICREHQQKCLEFTDRALAPLIDIFQRAGASILCMGDHGDCHGEDGLWAHGIYHEEVMKVPMVYHLRPRHISPDDLNLDNENVEVPVLDEMLNS